MTTLLAGDIGGTKTLLGLYSVEGTALIQRASQRYVSANWPDFSALVNHFLEGQAQTFERPQQACFAIAGPVRQGRVKLTNLPWLLEEERLARDCQLKAVEQARRDAAAEARAVDEAGRARGQRPRRSVV